MCEFLELMSSTLQSFLTAYTDDLPSMESNEAQFILALCGIITSELTLCGIITSELTLCGIITSELTLCGIITSELTLWYHH